MKKLWNFLWQCFSPDVMRNQGPNVCFHTNDIRLSVSQIKMASDKQTTCPKAHEISGHDKAILNRIFNPGLPSSDIDDELNAPPLVEGKCFIDFDFDVKTNTKSALHNKFKLFVDGLHSDCSATGPTATAHFANFVSCLICCQEGGRAHLSCTCMHT